MANEQTAKVNKSVNVGGITIGGTIGTVTGDTIITFQKAFPIGTNVEADVNLIDVSRVTLVAIESNKDCDVYTNAASGGSPDDHLVLKANQPLIWQTNDPAGSLFLTEDVTKVYVTNVAALVLKIGVVQDTTPVL